MDKKWQSFGWHVIKTDGHDIGALHDAFIRAKKCKGRPTVILAHTVKGKGVSYMENQAKWHGTAPNEAQYKEAMRELSREVP